MKAKLQEYGYLLSKEQIGSWNSTKTSRRKKGQICAETRVKSLQTHLQVLKDHKEKYPTQYWKAYNNGNVKIMRGIELTAVLYLFEVKGAKSVPEQLEQFTRLNRNQDQVDTKMLEVSRRIGNLESRIERARDATFDSGRSKDTENAQEQLQLESSLVARIQNPTQST